MTTLSNQEPPALPSRTYIQHRVETRPGQMPVSDYVEEITRNLTPEEEESLQRHVENIVHSLLREHGDFGNYATFSNEVGHRVVELAAKEAQLSLLKVAAEAYEFAYEEEEPYNANRTVYAANTIQAMRNFIGAKGDSLTDQDRQWISSKNPRLVEMKDCLGHFNNFTIMNQAYLNLQEEGRIVNWTDKALEDQAKDIQDAQKRAADLSSEIEALTT